MTDLTKLKDQLAEIKTEKTFAHREICDLASGKRKWEMCIPPQKTDSDMILQAPLDRIDYLIEKLELAVQTLEKMRDRRSYYWDAKCNMHDLQNEIKINLAEETLQKIARVE